MAVPWLDLVRFADTVGYHGDQNQHVFPYRDYVIDAFNRNKPFDQFTTEQLAGDLLPDPTPEQLVATGFNRLNMMTREGGAQPKEYLAKYAGDRVRTVAITWLGSTMGCAECHDHKFDPFTARDFYRMAAFFADVKQWGVYIGLRLHPQPRPPGVHQRPPVPARDRGREPLPEAAGSTRLDRPDPRPSRPPNRVDRPARSGSRAPGPSSIASRPAGRRPRRPSSKCPTPKDRSSSPGPTAPCWSSGKEGPKENATIVLEPRAGWVSSIRLERPGSRRVFRPRSPGKAT